MRKFIVSSKRFQGEIELVYDAQKLQSLHFGSATITPDVLADFKRAVPVLLVQFLSGKWSGTDTVAVEAEYEVPFEQFWKDYDKKINKARCLLLWSKMNKALQIAAWVGVKKYDAYLKREGWRQKADPETYLRNRGWDNEY